MQTLNRKLTITLVLVFLTLGGLACNAAAASRIGTPLPSQNIEPSADALASFNSKWRTLSLATPNGPFSVTFTDAELTSAAAAALAEAEADGGQAIPFRDVQVHLRPGAIDVYGTAQIDPLTVPGRITIVPVLGPDGRVRLDVADTQFGPLQMDAGLLSEVVRSVEQTINEPIQAAPFNITLTDVTITDGEITINGTITQ